MFADFGLLIVVSRVSSGGSELVLGPILSVSEIVLNLIMTIWGVNLDAVSRSKTEPLCFSSNKSTVLAISKSGTNSCRLFEWLSVLGSAHLGPYGGANTCADVLKQLQWEEFEA